MDLYQLIICKLAISNFENVADIKPILEYEDALF